jgi:DNA-binding MarR family transcriptional regulator
MARKLDRPDAPDASDAPDAPRPSDPSAPADNTLLLPYDSAVLSAMVRIVAAFTATPLLEQFATRAGIPATSKAVTALFALASSGPMRPSALAEKLDTSLAGASRVLDSLAVAKLAVRTADSRDARATIVTLTPAGHAAARELFRQGDLMMHELMGGWSDDDSSQLGLLLTRFASAIITHHQNHVNLNPPTDH